MASRSISELKNIGKTVVSRLHELGITDETELKKIGAARTYKWLFCSAHKEPVNVGNTIATSVNPTMRLVFENTLERKTIPTNSELTEARVNGAFL